MSTKSATAITYSVSVNVTRGNMMTSRSFSVAAESVEAAQERALAQYADLPDGEVSYTVTHDVVGYTPTIVRVDATDEYDEFMGRAYLTVWPVWRLSDGSEERGFGYGVGNNKRLAARLTAAIEAGVVFYNVVERVRDADGSHYAQASSHVMGRYMNADLRRLGF